MLRILAVLAVTFGVIYYPFSDIVSKFPSDVFDYFRNLVGRGVPPSRYKFMFARQWPISVCILEVIQKHGRTSQACKFPQQIHTWTIHGIWPHPRDRINPLPSDCGGAELQESDIQDIIGELNLRWPAIHQPPTDNPNHDPNFEFWKYQWRKHGACFNNVPSLNTPIKYFSKALEWDKRFNLAEAFMRCRPTNLPTAVLPSDSTTYSNETLIACLKTHLNWKFHIYLSYSPDTEFRNGKKILSEVRLCFSTQFRAADCYSTSTSTSTRTSTVDLYYPNTVENKISSSVFNRLFGS